MAVHACNPNPQEAPAGGLDKFKTSLICSQLVPHVRTLTKSHLIFLFSDLTLPNEKSFLGISTS